MTKEENNKENKMVLNNFLIKGFLVYRLKHTVTLSTSKSNTYCHKSNKGKRWLGFLKVRTAVALNVPSSLWFLPPWLFLHVKIIDFSVSTFSIYRIKGRVLRDSPHKTKVRIPFSKSQQISIDDSVSHWVRSSLLS